MFWGCFNGNKKGPYLFQEKEWGKINSESYYKRIIPLVKGWLRINLYLKFMQDNAPRYAAKATISNLLERGIIFIFQPAFSPNLNPIEKVWNQMKDWIKRQYREQKWTYNEL